MGGGASAVPKDAPFESVKAAEAAGKTKEEIDAWMAKFTEAAAVVASLDKDGDGKLDAKELVAAGMSDVPPEDWRYRPEVQAQVFAELSGGKDHLTFEDVENLPHHENPSFSEDDLKEEFAKANKSGNGMMTKSEFCTYYFNIEEAMKLCLDTTKGGLVKSRVYARVRPFSTDGTGHASGGDEVEKKLEKFDDKTLTVKDRHKSTTYAFATAVFIPEKTQQEVYDAIMPDLLDGWTTQCKNVMFFAYGQTGTGKTHTMFGSADSLKSDLPHEDWGLFPRLVHR